jgi:ribosome-binding factor A
VKKLSNDVRREKVAGEIKKIISEIISNELRDPAVPKLTSVISVEITADMSYAKVHISTLGTSEQLEAAVEGMKRAAGFVRSQLGSRMTIRHVPQLIFVADHSIERSIAIQQTLNKIHESQGGGNNAPKDS